MSVSRVELEHVAVIGAAWQGHICCRRCSWGSVPSKRRLFTRHHMKHSVPLMIISARWEWFQYKILLALFGTSLVIRLIALSIFPDLPLDTNSILVYLPGAQLLIEGNGFRDPTFSVLSPPLYAVAIATSSFILGSGDFAVKVLQVIADSVTVILIYFIASEIFDFNTAALTSLGWAFYPFAIYPTLYIGPEAFFTCALSGAILLIIYAIKLGAWKYYCAAGVLLGIATLTRATTQWFPIILLLVLVSIQPFKKRILLQYSVLLVSFCLVIAPWSLRNYLVLKEVIPVATSGGMVFLWGSSDEFLTINEREKYLPGYFELLKHRGIEFAAHSSGPSEKAAFLFRAGIESYKMQLEKDQLATLTFLIRKVLRLWYSTESGEKHLMILAVNIVIYILASVGLLLTWKRKNKLAILPLGLCVYFVLVHSITLPLFRYMVPVMPYVIAFSASTVVIVATSCRMNGIQPGSFQKDMRGQDLLSDNDSHGLRD